ncbi:30S ribosomal protein S13 [Candidatus Microgenomates bacterium]|nr:30S ribosomal protein S13 [Candidatus Microgenomates bacterium]
MIRIAGVQLLEKKRIDIALTQVYGVGRNNVVKLLGKTEIDVSTRVKDLTDKQVIKIQKAIDEYKVEGDLRREIQDNIKRLKRIRCYRGLRHISNLPVRGQRTRSNARTKRGKRATVGAMKKDTRAKMDKQKTVKDKKES